MKCKHGEPEEKELCFGTGSRWRIHYRLRINLRGKKRNPFLRSQVRPPRLLLLLFLPARRGKELFSLALKRRAAAAKAVRKEEADDDDDSLSSSLFWHLGTRIDALKRFGGLFFFRRPPRLAKSPQRPRRTSISHIFSQPDCVNPFSLIAREETQTHRPLGCSVVCSSLQLHLSRGFERRRRRRRRRALFVIRGERGGPRWSF